MSNPLCATPKRIQKKMMAILDLDSIGVVFPEAQGGAQVVHLTQRTIAVSKLGAQGQGRGTVGLGLQRDKVRYALKKSGQCEY